MHTLHASLKPASTHAELRPVRFRMPSFHNHRFTFDLRGSSMGEGRCCSTSRRERSFLLRRSERAEEMRGRRRVRVVRACGDAQTHKNKPKRRLVGRLLTDTSLGCRLRSLLHSLFPPLNLLPRSFTSLRAMPPSVPSASSADEATQQLHQLHLTAEQQQQQQENTPQQAAVAQAAKQTVLPVKQQQTIAAKVRTHGQAGARQRESIARADDSRRCCGCCCRSLMFAGE